MHDAARYSLVDIQEQGAEFSFEKLGHFCGFTKLPVDIINGIGHTASQLPRRRRCILLAE